jgi:hemerythrin-like domain-containing protein
MTISFPGHSAPAAGFEQRWQQLRASLEPIAAGASSSLDALSVEAFIHLYERHIASEESELLPVAKRILSETELDRVGRSMRERRGIHVIDGHVQQASRIG